MSKGKTYKITILRNGGRVGSTQLAGMTMDAMYNEVRRFMFRGLSSKEQAEFLELPDEPLSRWGYYAQHGFKLSVREVGK